MKRDNGKRDNGKRDIGKRDISKCLYSGGVPVEVFEYSVTKFEMALIVHILD